MKAGTVVGIVGTGLIGGSIGLRARELGWRVLGYDADPQAATQALRRKAIDEIVSKEAIYARSTIVVLATHVNGTLEELERINRLDARKQLLILDVASVKVPIVRAASGLHNFVASHPMAGAERSGADAADAGLFAERPWLYVPTGNHALDEQARQFITAIGGIPVAVTAQEHDATVALTSHLPQVFSSLFARRLSTKNADPYCGPAARELLRLSRSSAPMWRDIMQANHRNLAAELRGLAQDLLQTADALDRGEYDRWISG